MNSIRLMSMLDNEPSIRPTTTSSKHNFFYAVSIGWTTGIFTDWAEVYTSISDYSHTAHTTFEIKEEAEVYLYNNHYNQCFTPEHDKYSTSYRNVADMSIVRSTE